MKMIYRMVISLFLIGGISLASDLFVKEAEAHCGFRHPHHCTMNNIERNVQEAGHKVEDWVDNLSSKDSSNEGGTTLLSSLFLGDPISISGRVGHTPFSCGDKKFDVPNNKAVVEANQDQSILAGTTGSTEDGSYQFCSGNSRCLPYSNKYSIVARSVHNVYFYNATILADLQPGKNYTANFDMTYNETAACGNLNKPSGEKILTKKEVYLITAKNYYEAAKKLQGQGKLVQAMRYYSKARAWEASANKL